MSGNEPAHRLVLQVGCQRSGTTLLHLILNSHREIESFDENRFELFKQYVSLPQTPISQAPVVAFKFPLVSNPWNPDREFLSRAPGRPKYLFITRHVFDVVTSMCRLKFSVNATEVDWLNNAAAIYLRQRLHGGPMPDHLHSRAVFAATFWAEHNRYWLARLREVDGCHVRYEDLVQSPRATLEKALAFLGCEWDDAVLKHAQFQHAAGTGTVFGKTDPKRSIDEQSLGRWQSFLGAEDRERVLRAAGTVLQELGYDRPPVGAAAATESVGMRVR
jgi:hypothetical protein